MDRKYRQSGYQDGEKRPESKPSGPPRDREGPRSPKMMAFEGAFRCSACNTPNEVSLGALMVGETCVKCGADLRTCRNCTNFDPAKRWECSAPIEKRVASKTARTDCPQFHPSRTVEKKTGETRSPGDATNDAKAAFDRLFKK